MASRAEQPQNIFWIVYMMLLIVQFYSGECKDDYVKMDTATLKLAGDESIPTSALLHLKLNNRHVSLSLKRNINEENDIAVILLSKDEEGKFQTEDLESKPEKNATLYIDVNQRASFLMTFEELDDGITHIYMDGIVRSGRRIFHVRNPVPVETRFDSGGEDIYTTLNGTTQGEHILFIEVSELSLPKGPHRPHLIPTKEANSRNKNKNKKRKSRKRETEEEMYIDVVAMVDYAIYNRWYNRSFAPTSDKKREEAINGINLYFALVFNEIKLLYRSIATPLQFTVNVVLRSIIIATRESSSPWTEENRVVSKPLDEVNAGVALSKISEWIKNSTQLPGFDHIMLFTGHDLVSEENNITSKTVTGIAHKGGLCEKDGKSTSVVEDHGGFLCIKHAAHELGHSMSAEHDGDLNACDRMGNFIMSEVGVRRTEANKLNPWKFSTCSISYFNSFITRLVISKSGQDCLYLVGFGPNKPPDVTHLMPGKMYSLSQQCQQLFGYGSYVCQNMANWQESDLCNLAYCFKVDAAACFEFTPAQGTTCGINKRCVNGLCEEDPAAPDVPDTCSSGDIYGFTYFNKPCQQLVSEFPGYCYNEVVKRGCCYSCGAVYAPVTNCEYGDKTTSCEKDACRWQKGEYMQLCCRSCGSRVWAAPTPPNMPPIFDFTTPYVYSPTRIHVYKCDPETKIGCGAEKLISSFYKVIFLIIISMVM